MSELKTLEVSQTMDVKTTAPGLRRPGLSPMERQLLDQVVLVERQARLREARLEKKVAELEMLVGNLNSTVASLIDCLDTLLTPGAPSTS